MELSENHIVAAIQAGGRPLERVLGQLYRKGGYQEAVKAMLLRMGGSVQEVDDLFQDGIAHVVMNVRKGRFKGDSKLKTYLVAICRNLWLQKLYRKQKLQDILSTMPLAEQEMPSPENMMMFNEKQELLQSLMSSMGGTCQRVLSMWTLEYSMQEIASEVGYKSAGMARKKKHQCLNKLLEYVQNNSSLKIQLRQAHE